MEASLVERLADILNRYGMVTPGQRVGVAVSGGADSVCLLHLLHALGLPLFVVHVNHRLRGSESDADEEFVRGLAESLNLPIAVQSMDVRSLDANLEQAGRKARRAFYREAMAEHGLQAVATGHTRSDQAETVLYRLMRGSGTMGLAGIAPVTAEGLIRPLLEFERPELIAWLQERGLPWREDASNADRNFVRNRIRHELLPALSKDYNPRIGEALANLATLARDEEQYWSAEVERIAAGMFARQQGVVILNAATLAALPRAVARRVVRKGIQEVKGDLRSIDFDHVERVLGLTGGEHGHGRVILPGVDVFLSFEWLRFAKPRPESRWDRNYEVSLSVPGVFEVPGQTRCIELQVLEMSETGSRDGTKPGYNEDWNSLDFGRIDGPLVLRNWYPGDHLTRVGHSEDKVKLLFQQARIPIWDRQGWPIITSGDRIVWVRQFGPAAEYASRPESTRLLLISEREIIR